MIENLLKYQQEDAKLREIEKKLASSEERKKALEARKYLDGAIGLVDKLDDRAGELLLAYEELKSVTEKLDEQREEFASAFEGIKDEKMANYVSKKAEELTAKIKNISAKIKKLEEEVMAIAKEYSSIKKRTDAEKESYEENAKKYNEFKSSFSDEMTAIKEELKKLEGEVDPALMDKYRKKRENKMYPIVYAMEEHGKNNLCGMCQVEFSLLEVSKLKAGEIVECPSCGRLNYCKK